MSKWLIMPAILIFICIVITGYYGVEKNSPETTVEYHTVVGIMDDGSYLMESPDGSLYLFNGHQPGLEPGNMIIIQKKTDGNFFGGLLFVLLAIFSFFSLLILIYLSSDT